ncbi:MAG: phosphoglycolate phosphatase [Gammaproteobacteria bacterium]|nr:MAG: phosphoglycolate phosphatase [Gammaproteobacteria bacterium]
MKDHQIRTILFDLDGTLLDTAPDLAYALNTVLAEQARDTLPFETIRPCVSFGGIALVKLGFPEVPPGSDQFEDLRQRLLAVYLENIARQTRPFPGMDTLLEHIEALDMNWGVVTNKPGWLTGPLMDTLQLSSRAACIISGDTTMQRKPHPEPMLHACRLAGSNADQCLYVGDARRDIEAGHNAGMLTMVALFGYIPADEEPGQWGADAMVEHPNGIINWLEQHNATT